jgi:hypothetical protein
MRDQEVMRYLDPETESTSGELRGLERELRRHIAVMHSEDLCWSHTYCRFLDESMTSVGVTSRERQLEQRLSAVKLLISEQESEEQKVADKKRERLLATLAVLGVLSITGAFGVLDRASRSGDAVKGPLVVAVEMFILAVLLVLVGGWIFWTIEAISWNPFRWVSRLPGLKAPSPARGRRQERRQHRGSQT